MVEDGVEMPDRNQELCLGRVVHLTSLQQLVIQRGASAIWGPSLPTLHQLAGLTQLHLMGEGEPWQADEYPVWQSALAALTGLKARSSHSRTQHSSTPLLQGCEWPTCGLREPCNVQPRSL